MNLFAGYLIGLTIEAFIAHLQAAQSAFCAALSAHGVAYLHAPALGCPKPIRNQYKADGNWQTHTREFLEYIQPQDASLT